MRRPLLVLTVLSLLVLPAAANAQPLAGGLDATSDIGASASTTRSPDLLGDGDLLPDVFGAAPATGAAQPREDLGGILRGSSSDGFEVVGHSPLNSRGMNSAIAVHDGFAYVGSRTDGQPQHRTPGVLVVDVRDPSTPSVVGEITDGLSGDVSHTSRELRVWPEQDLLIVMQFGCSGIIHACAGSEAASQNRFEFFDIAGELAAAPELIASYTPPRVPHEFFLWVDPLAPADRALLYWTSPTSSRTAPNLYITDISAAREDRFSEIGWVADFPARTLDSGEAEDRRLHSIGVSTDGRTTHLAFLGAGYLALDTSQVVDGAPTPEISLLTDAEDRATWTNPGAHTSIVIPGNPGRVLVTDEVYGDLVTPIAGGEHGCPWGWIRTLDVEDLAKPSVTAEYRLPENDEAYCQQLLEGSPANTLATSYSAHNPTLTPDLAFISWHSAGLQVVDISDPDAPTFAGQFKPEPLPFVVTEDPALSLGLDKVVMWSYPVIADGLVYVVDVRNGLYILEWTGEHADEIAEIDFLEGNSNLGDALRYDPVTAPVEQSGAQSSAATLVVGGALLAGLARLRRRDDSVPTP
jgi:hypothetical protein